MYRNTHLFSPTTDAFNLFSQLFRKNYLHYFKSSKQCPVTASHHRILLNYPFIHKNVSVVISKEGFKSQFWFEEYGAA